MSAEVVEHEQATMTAAVWTGSETLSIQKVAVPRPPSGSALVRVEFSGLCGTDFGILHGTHPRARPPLVMGHEIIGTVAVAAADGPPVGARVVVEPLINCGHCSACLTGNRHVCRNLELFGIDAPGSLAEFVALPARSLLPVRSTVPLPQAALAEPLAVAVHAVHRSGLSGGERILIFGAGPIGILIALVAKHSGAERILISEPSAERSAVARSLGFDTVRAGEDPDLAIAALTDGAGADIVFDSAAHPSVAAGLAKAVRVRGTIVLVGVYKKPAEVDLQALTFAENTIVGVRVYTRADVEEAISLIESGALGLERFPVEVFPLEAANEAFDRAMAASATLKVFISSSSDDRKAGSVQ